MYVRVRACTCVYVRVRACTCVYVRVRACTCVYVRVRACTTSGCVPVNGREEAARRQHEGSSGQDGAPVVHPVQVTPGHVRHADGPGRAVQELVPVPETSATNHTQDERSVHTCDRSPGKTPDINTSAS